MADDADATVRYVLEDEPGEWRSAAERLARALRATGARLEVRTWDGAGLAPFRRDWQPGERAPWGAPTLAAAGVPAHEVATLVDGPVLAQPDGVPSIVCDPVPGDGGVPLDLPADVVLFYVVGKRDFDEALENAVRAFLASFTGDDAVALVVRVPDAEVTPTMIAVAKLVGEYTHPPAVHLECQPWPPERLAGLHARGDCYISPPDARSDLHALDAAAYANPVVPSSDTDGLRAVAADPDAARTDAVARAHVLAEHSAARAVSLLRTRVPELDLPEVPEICAASIPRLAHFVFGLREQPEPFHLIHELAVRSCLDVVQPDEVFLHCHHEPFGPHWERIASDVTVRPVDRVDAVDQFRYPDPVVGRYSYAHHADFVRLDVLAEFGGLYADLDTLFVAPIPDELWRKPFVIGREADVLDGHNPVPRPALSNALLMATPDSRFLAAWRAEIGRVFDGAWATHSCFLAEDLARRMPAHVHVESQLAFHAFEPTVAGLALLLDHPPPDLDGVFSMHLAAHLWWAEQRMDFSTVHAGLIDEAWIRTSPSTYASCARRFLPSSPS